MQQNDSLADGQVKHDVFGYIVPSWVDDVEEHVPPVITTISRRYYIHPRLNLLTQHV